MKKMSETIARVKFNRDLSILVKTWEKMTTTSKKVELAYIHSMRKYRKVLLVAYPHRNKLKKLLLTDFVTKIRLIASFYALYLVPSISTSIVRYFFYYNHNHSRAITHSVAKKKQTRNRNEISVWWQCKRMNLSNVHIHQCQHQRQEA